MASPVTPHVVIVGHWCRVIVLCVISPGLSKTPRTGKMRHGWEQSGNLLTPPGPGFSIFSREGRMCAWRSWGCSVTCARKSGQRGWLVHAFVHAFALRILQPRTFLVPHGEGTCSSHTALSLKTGSFLPRLSLGKFSPLYKLLFPLLWEGKLTCLPGLF